MAGNFAADKRKIGQLQERLLRIEHRLFAPENCDDFFEVVVGPGNLDDNRLGYFKTAKNWQRCHRPRRKGEYLLACPMHELVSRFASCFV